MDSMLEMGSLLRWPLLACLFLPWLLVYLGLHIVERQVIFVDLALAQVAALGSCLALLLGHDLHDWHNFALSLAFTFGGAILITLTRTRNHRTPQEALIGIIYVVSAAAAILMLNFTTEGHEALQRSLVGELLVVPKGEILKTFGLYVVVGVIHWVFRSKFLALSTNPAEAAASGLAVRWWDFLFYVLFGLVVTSFVHIGGVLLVFSYLIIPAVSAGFLATSFRWRFFLGWLMATITGGLSLLATARMDLPLGPAIVCGLGAMLVLTILGTFIRDVWRRRAQSAGQEGESANSTLRTPDR